ncbi:hypothetical protein [Paenibacillus dakarensis]|uniref:hypothetical protein n=1 Tax=Paenibacillus dakarensis TaxID=1527293 RepID=UPI0006D58C41|nr:hypothetical protein [Paenibacillus dakarensis]
MDDIHRKRDRLAEKLAVNRQKIFAKNAAKELSGKLDLSEILVGRECDEVLKQLKRNSRILSVHSYRPTEEEIREFSHRRLYQEFGFREKVLSRLSLIRPLAVNSPAHLWFNHIESPVFVMELNDLVSGVHELCLFSGFDFVFADTDYVSGIAVSHSGGYVTDDFNPEEIIYELEAWGVFASMIQDELS